MYHSLFIHSSTKGHLPCFQVSAIMSKVSGFFFHRHTFSTPLSKIPRNIIVGSSDRSMFSFLRNRQTANHKTKTPKPSKVDEPYCILTSNGWKFLLFQILASVRWCQGSGFGHSVRYMVVFHCYFNFLFLMICDMEHLLICRFSICISSMMRCPLKSLAHFSIGLSSYCSDIRVLWIFW